MAGVSRVRLFVATASILLGLVTTTFSQRIDRFAVDVSFPTPHAISRNGEYVVGGSDPWVWNRATGVTILPTNADDRNGTVDYAIAISDDGSLIAGSGQVVPRCDDDRELFLFEHGAWSSLLDDDSEFGGLSANGTLVGANAYRFRDSDDCPSATGMYESAVRIGGENVRILPPPDGLDHSVVIGVSATGEVMAGNAVHAITPEGNWLLQGVVWDSSGVPNAIPMPPGADEVRATAIAGDGMTVVGYVEYTDDNESSRAFHWNPEAGLTTLNGDAAQAVDVSFDGSVVVGVSQALGSVVWLDGMGPGALTDYLSDFGFDDAAFRFVDMSDDGRTFLGTSGSEIVVVTVPEPSAAAIVLAGMVALGILRQRLIGR